jgi:hypothetical protein
MMAYIALVKEIDPDFVFDPDYVLPAAEPDEEKQEE